MISMSLKDIPRYYVKPIIHDAQGTTLDLEEGAAAVADDEQRATLQAIMSNARVSERYLALARDLDVMASRTPEEVSVKLKMRN